MAVGLGEKFNILETSPHDLQRLSGDGSALESDEASHWVPSRYSVRATTDSGQLVLWNTLSGKITVFQPEARESVLGLLKKSGFEAPKEGVVKYLVDRGYLIKHGVDEFQKFQHIFGQQHYRPDVLELILMSSEDCNFRCGYCYEDFERGTMLPEVRESVKNLVRKRIDKLNRLSVSWFGGEPLYGWQAVQDLAPFMTEIIEEYGVPYSSHMTTNGYLLTPDVADKLFAWRIRHFQITLDGLPDYHDQSRPARDGSPTFQRIFSNLSSLAQREDNFHVTIRVNVDKNNAQSMPEFVDLLSTEFHDDPRFSVDMHAVGKLGGPNDATLGVCTDEDMTTALQDLQAEARRQGIHFGSLRDAARVGSKVCYAARPYNFLIGATGKVMKCTVLLDKVDYNIVGRLTQDGDLDLDLSKMAIWTEPAFEQDQQCKKCIVLPTCQGISCPLVRIEHNTQPCISTRKKAKQELLAVLGTPGSKGRRLLVDRENVTTLEAPQSVGSSS